MSAPGPRDFDAGIDEGFVRRTYRSTAVLAGAAALFAWRFGAAWASLPILAGAVIGLALLWAGETGLRRLLEPGRVGAVTAAGPEATKGARRAIGALAVVKYILALAALAALSRVWDTTRLAAVAGGIALVPLDITLRTIGRLIAAGQR